MKPKKVDGKGDNTITVIDEGFNKPLQVASPHGRPLPLETLKNTLEATREPYKPNRKERRQNKKKKGR